MSGGESFNPFPGPQPYRVADHHRFFGREAASRKLLNRILAHPCVTLFGPSGAGKSSLMQASVIPVLVEHHCFRVVRVDGWLTCEVPLERLALSMFAQLELGAPPLGRTSRQLLEQALDLAARRSSRPILIYLDQLEQLLLPGRPPEHLHELLEGLAALVLAPVRGLQLALALREDYLGRLRDQARDFRVLLDPGFRLGPFTVNEMAQVACKLARAGVPPQEWDCEGLRTLMMQMRTGGQAETDEAEVQAAFAQIVCRALWEERKSGASAASPVNAELILHRYLDATLDSLGPLKPAAVKLLEERLVAEDGSRTLLTQQQAEEELSPSAAEVVLNSLERAAVLHAEEHQGSRYFELGHDWLAKKVLELKRTRLEEEEQARRRQEEAERLRRERVVRRKLVMITAAVSMVAFLLLGLFLWGWKARSNAVASAEEAFDQSLIAGAREQMQRGQPTVAAKLLAEVKHPEQVASWKTLAWEALDSNFVELTLQGDRRASFNAAAFSPDGQRIVSASDDGTAQVWWADRGQPQELKGHTGPVTDAEFSPDGQYIITASRDGTARLWRVEGAVQLRVFQHAGPVRSAGFSPDGQRIITVSTDPESRETSAQVWRADDSSAPSQVLKRGPHKSVNFAAFSPGLEAQRVVTTSWDGTAQVWQADGSGRFSLRQELAEHTGPVTSAAFSRDGARLVTASQDGSACVWRAEGEGPKRSFILDKKLEGHDGPVLSASFSQGGEYLVTAAWDGIARVWWAPASGPAAMITALKGHTGPVSTATFRLSGQSASAQEVEESRVVTASQDGTVRVWHADLRRQPAVRMVMEHREPVVAAAVSPEPAGLIVTASQDGVARIWQADGSQPPAELSGHTLSLTSVALSQDSQRIATGSWDKTARVWERRDGGWTSSVFQHHGPVTSVAFSPDGTLLVTGSTDGVARVWRTGTPSEPILELKPGPRESALALSSAAFSPNGKLIVTASRDGIARVWNADGSGQPRKLQGHMGPVTSAAFSPDGKRIATTSQDGDVRVWKLKDEDSGELLDEQPVRLSHEGPLLSAAFSSDGERLVTGSWDATVWVWRTDGLGRPRVLKGHEGPVRSAVFSQADRRIVTASWDKTVRIWSLPELELPEDPALIMVQLKERNRDCLPAAMRMTYLKEEPAEAQDRSEECEQDHRVAPVQAVARRRSGSRAAGSPNRR